MSTPKVIEVHNSDREQWRRCRRKWSWQSRLGENLVQIGGGESRNTFIGSGFHYAMEDYHGHRRWEHPALAFAAYVDAHKTSELPIDDMDEILDLATGMLDYYQGDWLAQHPEEFSTLWVDGVPQVEVEIAVDVTALLLEDKVYRRMFEAEYKDSLVHLVMTLDRVAQDRHDRIWPLDYKTGANLDELNLQTNPQAGTYDWGAHLFYEGFDVGGLIWQQHKRTYPKPPEWLTTKHRFSTDARAATTFSIYRRTILEYYGDIPAQYRPRLDTLASEQDSNGDKYIRRDLLRRNDEQRRNEQAKIVDEIREMLDPGMALYPNPTRDCSWDCPFKAPCLAKDDGSDYEFMLNGEYEEWEGYQDTWRSRVIYPDAKSEPTKKEKSNGAAKEVRPPLEVIRGGKQPGGDRKPA